MGGGLTLWFDVLPGDLASLSSFSSEGNRICVSASSCSYACASRLSFWNWTICSWLLVLGEGKTTQTFNQQQFWRRSLRVPTFVCPETLTSEASSPVAAVSAVAPCRAQAGRAATSPQVRWGTGWAWIRAGHKKVEDKWFWEEGEGRKQESVGKP